MHRDTRHLSRLFLLCAVFGLLLLAAFVILVPESRFDLWVSREIQERRSSPLTLFMRFVSAFGNMPIPLLTLPVAALAYYGAGYRREAAFVFATPLADLANLGIKYAVQRARPAAPVVEVLHALTTPSFPSSHVVHYTVFFGFVLATMFALRKIDERIRGVIGVACLLLLLTIGVSRVYLGAHWATDALGGYLVGGFLLAVLLGFYRKTVIAVTPEGAAR